ncbi:uncharacterized protein EV420DRAFT_1763124 [Desarmillaria tabescens]|uniref:Mid2 domain-containing protein n=1 Tax=Armillaria tabescens TaxID=1929756 RepID=A0AA39KHY8_ARMTA|nr:uncharacterized protein EV420DRAFT_1763124 [Desarmillaria tabescens]KAK0460209.1 hypothetical protein EV420DRAFT_1763124 [Desarmillaria tabescens]
MNGVTNITGIAIPPIPDDIIEDPTIISTSIHNIESTATVTIANIRTTTTTLSPSVSLQASSDSSRRTSPAVIAGSVIGSLASVAVLVLVFVLWRRRERRNRANSNASDDIGLGTTSAPNPIITPALTSSTQAGSRQSFTSESSRRLSWSSRLAYEDEIERLQEENLSQRNQIRYLDEQLEFTYRASPPPPSYRSRRSEISDRFVSPQYWM